MSDELLGPRANDTTTPTQRAMAARAEAAVLLGDVRADLSRWSKALEEAEVALRSDDVRPLEDHAELMSARNRLFDTLAELASLADPYSVWAAAAPDVSDPS